MSSVYHNYFGLLGTCVEWVNAGTRTNRKAKDRDCTKKFWVRNQESSLDLSKS
jgi:hypothetical protein